MVGPHAVARVGEVQLRGRAVFSAKNGHDVSGVLRVSDQLNSSAPIPKPHLLELLKEPCPRAETGTSLGL